MIGMIQSTPFFTRLAPEPKLMEVPEVLRAVFSDAVFKDGNNSQPISLQDGSLIVVRIQEKHPAHVPDLSVIQSQIRERIIQKKAAAQAALFAHSLLESLKAGHSLADITSRQAEGEHDD